MFNFAGMVHTTHIVTTLHVQTCKSHMYRMCSVCGQGRPALSCCGSYAKMNCCGSPALNFCGSCAPLSLVPADL